MSASENARSRLAVCAAAKAHPVFEQEQWHYFGDDGVPSVERLTASLASTLERMTQDPSILYSRSGHFRVVRDSNQEEGYRLGPDELTICLELGSVELSDSDPQSEIMQPPEES